MFLLIIIMMNLDRYFAFAFFYELLLFHNKEIYNVLAWILTFFLTYGMLLNYHANSVLTCEVIFNFLKSDVNTTCK